MVKIKLQIKIRPLKIFNAFLQLLILIVTVGFYPLSVYCEPDAITDLSPKSAGFRHIVLQWTAPTGPEGTPLWYEIRTSSYRVIVTENDWNNNSTSSAYPYRVKFATTTTAGFLENRVISSLVNGQEYFFAIKSSTDNINWSSLDSSSPEPYAKPYNSPPVAVVGHNLENNTIVYTSSVYLSWAAPSPGSNDALFGDSISSYRLWYSTMSNFAVKVIVDPITQTNWTTPPLMENTTYYWRVWAKDSEGLESPSVITRNFIVNATSEPPNSFSLVQPVNDYIERGTLRPTLYWAASSDPDPGDSVVYDIYISTENNFLVKVTTKITGIEETQWTFQWDLTENARYFWKVHARDTTGLERISNSTESFRLNTLGSPPASFGLIYPVNGTMIFTSSPTLIWQEAIDVDPGDIVYYGISYSSTTSNPPDPTSFLLMTTFYQITHLEEDVVYWWRVVAKSYPDNLTTSSSISSFTVNAKNGAPATFNLISSSGIVRTATPKFFWYATTDPDGDDVSYTIYYSSYSDFSSFFSSANLTSTAFVATEPLTENTTYWWKVAACDIYGAKTFSTTWFLIVDVYNEKPYSFNLISSSGIVKTQTPIFKWEQSVDPDPGDLINYNIYYSSTSNFLTVFSSIGLINTTFIPEIPLEENTTYWWYVSSYDSGGLSAFSKATWFVVVDAINEDPHNFSLLFPIDDYRVSYSGINFCWEAASDPDPYDSISHYTIVYSTDSLFNIKTEVSSILTTSYLLTVNLTNNTTYYWYVRANSSLSGYRNSDIENFLTISLPPASFDLISPSGIVNTATPIFVWNASCDPENEIILYDIHYSTLSDFSIFTSSLNILTTYYTSPPLSENATYWWRVIAKDIYNNSRNSENTFVLMINAIEESPGSSDLIYPPDKSTIETLLPTFAWSDSTDPDPGDYVRYILWYSTRPDFASRFVVENLTEPLYKIQIDTPLSADLTYYWMVYAVDKTNRSAASDIWSFYLKPRVRPSAPAAFRGVVSEDKKSVVLSWLPPTTNSDGTAIGGSIRGYEIYKAFSFEDVFTARYYAIVSSATLSWMDILTTAEVFYAIRTVNDLGIVGEPSVVLKIGSENLSYHYNADRTVILEGRTDILCSQYRVEISTTLLPADDTRTLYSYHIKVIDSNGQLLKMFPEPIQIKIKIPENSQSHSRTQSLGENDYAIYFFNGVEWVNLGGKIKNSYLVVRTNFVGDFRVRRVARAAEFKILSIWPKVITPNDDGKNDKFNITFENPYSENVEGRIYDINGLEISKMRGESDSQVIWDGKDNNGNAVVTGVYIYQLKVGNKTKNGTVVVAR